MADLTDAQYKVLIIAETDADDYPEIASKYIDLYWSANSGAKTKAIQKCLTKIDVLKYIAGKLRRKVNATIGRDKTEASAMFSQAMSLLKEEQAEHGRLDPYSKVPPMGVNHLESVLYEPMQDTVDRYEDGEYYLGDGGK